MAVIINVAIEGDYSMNLLGYITIMVIPVTSFILGILFTVKPVTRINNLAGHRTKYSKLSQ